jgi:hypothetical protein
LKRRQGAAFMALGNASEPTVEYEDCYGNLHENRTSIAGAVGLCGLRAVLPRSLW